MEIEDVTQKDWLLDGLFIAALLAIAYAVLFAYEAGQAVVYGIPLTWIRIHPAAVLLAAGILALASLQAYSPAVSVLSLIRPLRPLASWAQDHFWRRLVVRNLLPTAVLLGVVAAIVRLAHLDWKIFRCALWITGTLCVAGILVEALLLAFAEHRFGKKVRGDTLEATMGAVFSFIGLGTKSFEFPLIFVGVCALVFCAGKERVYHRTHYLVTRSAPQLVLLHTYGNLAVGAPLDNPKRNLVVFALGSDARSQLEKAELGILFPRPAPEQKPRPNAKGKKPKPKKS